MERPPLPERTTTVNSGVTRLITPVDSATEGGQWNRDGEINTAVSC
jgi:hypothetical protein